MKSYDKPRQCIKKQRHHFANKGLYSQSYSFSSSHVQMWELDHQRRLSTKELMPSNCGTREDSWESFEQQGKLINPKGNQPWIFTGRTKAEAPILWPHNGKSQLTGKDPDAGKDWRQEEKGTTEDEVVGWHYWLNGHEFGQTQWDREGHARLACCSSWGCKELDTT